MSSDITERHALARMPNGKLLFLEVVEQLQKKLVQLLYESRVASYAVRRHLMSQVAAAVRQHPAREATLCGGQQRAAATRTSCGRGRTVLWDS